MSLLFLVSSYYSFPSLPPSLYIHKFTLLVSLSLSLPHTYSLSLLLCMPSLYIYQHNNTNTITIENTLPHSNATHSNRQQHIATPGICPQPDRHIEHNTNIYTRAATQQNKTKQMITRPPDRLSPLSFFIPPSPPRETLPYFFPPLTNMEVIRR